MPRAAAGCRRCGPPARLCWCPHARIPLRLRRISCGRPRPFAAPGLTAASPARSGHGRCAPPSPAAASPRGGPWRSRPAGRYAPPPPAPGGARPGRPGSRRGSAAAASVRRRPRRRPQVRHDARLSRGDGEFPADPRGLAGAHQCVQLTPHGAARRTGMLGGGRQGSAGNAGGIRLEGTSQMRRGTARKARIVQLRRPQSSIAACSGAAPPMAFHAPSRAEPLPSPPVRTSVAMTLRTSDGRQPMALPIPQYQFCPDARRARTARPRSPGRRHARDAGAGDGGEACVSVCWILLIVPMAFSCWCAGPR